MKVLWFSNVPLPAMLQQAGRGSETCKGHWIVRSLEYASREQLIEFAVVAAFPGLRDTKFQEHGITYYTIGQPRRFNLFSHSEEDLRRCADAVADFNPDFIHIHGTERFYGLLKVKELAKVPVLVSIQGLLGVFSRRRVFFGALSLRDISASIRLLELPAKLGLFWQYLYTVKAAKREAVILANVDGIIGRTQWDRAHVAACNPLVPYYHVGEIMRQSFYDRQWSVDGCNRHSLIYTNAGHPSRGIENILAAILILRRDYPDIKLRLAGAVSERSGYGRFLKRRINALGLHGVVEFAGFLDEAQMTDALLRAHIFVIASYIENSPNSLAEAMLLGMPCVAGYTGGIPDMIEPEKTGLLYPVEDVPLLAERIKRIFTDDRLATNLAEDARHVALQRHDPEAVTAQLLAAYEQFIASRSE